VWRDLSLSGYLRRPQDGCTPAPAPDASLRVVLDVGRLALFRARARVNGAVELVFLQLAVHVLP
jgi:hypothetical protein